MSDTNVMDTSEWKEYIKTYDILKCVDYLKEFPEKETDGFLDISMRIQVKKRLIELLKDVL